PLTWTAAAYLAPGNSNSAGAAVCWSASTATLVPTVFFTTTGTSPVVVSSAASTLICVGLIKATAADFPLMVTLMPSSEVGSCPFTKSALRQGRVVAESAVPNTETQVPGAIALPYPAPSSTPPDAA